MQEGRAVVTRLGLHQPPQRGPVPGVGQAGLVQSKGANSTDGPLTPASSHVLLPPHPTFLQCPSCRAPLWENVPGPR